ncbi:hypothetical protein A3A60_02020 [Candidatus Curtissbacteria bacterium RIFCSPLOWO2_01_FULL_42_26]|uniref:Response regulatory domain-containing protein n=1 Tax=Candidatus Curtissbacteria bacterium RIFCSPLOWO2_01_FULL_42_26 TaxID=1797729 RepID=A0A1F5I4H8_9BACT|nr:MAG: hypothetical protein A3A60_02020 [Candidatus Curtissbacteria bacterium RIFCSPLOWO2_01_FULL_42_26]
MNTKPIVMVIEDEELLLQAITKKLKLSNLDVIACNNGHQAIDHFKDLNNKPDAIWLDYYLGDMDGINFMEKLKSHKELANIPVLVVSNSASPDKVHRMLALGAKEYFIKAEHRLDELVDQIKKFIEEKN